MNPRLALLALGYAALVAYASLYPFSWRATGADPLGFLSGEWAVVAPNGDNLANVLAYLPLGLLKPRRLSRHYRQAFNRRNRGSLVVPPSAISLR